MDRYGPEKWREGQCFVSRRVAGPRTRPWLLADGTDMHACKFDSLWCASFRYSRIVCLLGSLTQIMALQKLENKITNGAQIVRTKSRTLYFDGVPFLYLAPRARTLISRSGKGYKASRRVVYLVKVAVL